MTAKISDAPSVKQTPMLVSVDYSRDSTLRFDCSTDHNNYAFSHLLRPLPMHILVDKEALRVPSSSRDC